MIILKPKNVIFERFWPLSKFYFPACSTLDMSQVSFPANHRLYLCSNALHWLARSDTLDRRSSFSSRGIYAILYSERLLFHCKCYIADHYFAYPALFATFSLLVLKKDIIYVVITIWFLVPLVNYLTSIRPFLRLYFKLWTWGSVIYCYHLTFHLSRNWMKSEFSRAVCLDNNVICWINPVG